MCLIFKRFIFNFFSAYRNPIKNNGTSSFGLFHICFGLCVVACMKYSLLSCSLCQFVAGSKFIMENALESLSPDSHRICLRGNDLTSLSHLQYLACLAEVDVSHNALRHIRDGFLLQRVCTLDLSHNEMATCEGLAGLPALQTLDLSHNRILSTDSVLF